MDDWLDQLTTVDESLRSIHSTIEEDLIPPVVGIANSVDEDRTRSFQLEFSEEIDPSTTTADPVEVTRTVPFGGRITTFFVGWPDGTQNAAGIQLERNEGERLFPRNKEDQFIALNDVSHPFDLRAPVNKGEDLTVKFTNADTNESHFLNAVVTVTEVV